MRLLSWITDSGRKLGLGPAQRNRHWMEIRLSRLDPAGFEIQIRVLVTSSAS